MKIWINETVSEEDQGEGGVGRVVRAQREWFPRMGHEIVDDPAHADVLACHITADEKVLARHPDKALVAHIHGLYWAEYEWNSWCHKANGNVLDAIGAADLTTVPTHWVANAVRRHTSRETVVIPHGVDLEEWTPKERDAELPQYVLWDKNRPDPVCDPGPMNELARRMPGVNFISTFGQEAANVMLSGKVPYAQAREIMLGASVYLATTRETFGISTVQAMSAGVPVAGWDWGGQAEFLGPGGLLVPPGDYDALEDAVRTLMAERETYSRAARETAEAIGGWQPLMEAYIASYERAIAIADRTSPRVSIIVPAYGLADYLPDALDSVLEQTETDWECIVVDDASPDGCGEIADQYAERDDRFRVIHNETNQYLAGARNTGIAAARGRYILPLDADDLLPVRAVQTLANALDADRTIHVAYGGVLFVDQDGATPTVYPGWERSPGHSGWPMEFNFEWQAYERNLLPYSSMFRRRAWEQTGGYRTRCRTAEDADFWLRLSSYGFRPVKVTTADTLIYRNREDSMSRQEGQVEWSRWFSWGSRHRRRPPAGWTAGLDSGTATAESAVHPDVPSLDPSAVAVIIPVGPGHEAIVRDAIDSVEAQTWEQWECIVVNDSGNELGPLPQWVTVLETPEAASGVAIARNVGVAACRSTWFLPLDADDLLEPTALETWVSVATQHPDDVLYSDFYEDPQVEGEFSIYQAPDYEPRDLVRNGAIHIVTALTPVALWKELGGYATDTAWEDWAFQIETAAQGRCSRRIARPLITYRKHTGTRREDNYQNFERSKADIQRRYNDYWEGGKTLMACNSCPGGKQTTIGGGALAGSTMNSRQSAPDGMELLLFPGPRGGSFNIKGQSGQRYRVQKDRPFYCRTDDVGGLIAMGYQRVTPEALEAAAPAPPQPALVVAGRPVAIPSTLGGGVQTQTPTTPTTTQSTGPTRCMADTKTSGERCSRNAVDGRHCAQHKVAA